MHRSIQRFEKAGIADLHIEDEVAPEHSAFNGPLLPIRDMQARIRAAVDARRRDDFVLIVRSDELYDVGGGGGGSVQEAVRRGVAYEEAGADVYLPTFATEEQLAVIGREVSIPPACYGALLPAAEFSSSTGWGTASAARLHRQWATQLMEHGELPPEAFDFPGKSEAIQQSTYDAVIERRVTATERPRRPSTSP